MSEVHILPLAITDADLNLIGGKGMSLASLSAAGFPVPDGFHVNADAYRAYIETHDLHDQLMRLAVPALADQRVSFEAASNGIQALFSDHDVPDSIAGAIASAYRSLEGAVGAVAVRSSANAEDLPDLSFAGQQDTFLNVQGEEAVMRRCETAGRHCGPRGRSAIATTWVSTTTWWRCQWLCNAWWMPRLPACCSQ